MPDLTTPAGRDELRRQVEREKRLWGEDRHTLCLCNADLLALLDQAGAGERVAELEATAARRLELLRELRDSFCAAAKLPSREPNVKMIREMGHYLRLIDRVDAEISAAAGVAAGEK